MNKTTLIVSVFLSGLIVASGAFAAEPNILYATASQYQNAITKLEQTICQSQVIRQADRNLVNQFDRAAKRMVLAAKNPRNINRLRFERQRVYPLQLQVEADLFEKYSPNLQLVRTWEYLLWAQAVFDEELAHYVANPRGGGMIQRRISSSQPSRYLSLPPGYVPQPPVNPLQTVISP